MAEQVIYLRERAECKSSSAHQESRRLEAPTPRPPFLHPSLVPRGCHRRIRGPPEPVAQSFCDDTIALGYGVFAMRYRVELLFRATVDDESLHDILIGANTYAIVDTVEATHDKGGEDYRFAARIDAPSPEAALGSLLTFPRPDVRACRVGGGRIAAPGSDRARRTTSPRRVVVFPRLSGSAIERFMDRDIVVSELSFAPGGYSGRHSHPGKVIVG
ncbi:MAG: hypothetical protein M3P18_19050 [Actinomycetota bacterium]|nr:hypothetical protein [Actinomycetota bacterium]